MRQGGGKFAASRLPGGGPVELAVLPSSGGVEVASCASASPGGARCLHRWEERQTGIEPRWAVVRRHVGEREPLGGSLEGHAVVVAEHRGPRDAPAKKKRDPNTKKVRFRDYCDGVMCADGCSHRTGMTRSSSEDKKPEGYDDIPKEIIYPDVTKHEDWDEEEYGEWTAPTIPNVDYKGPWTQKKIKNPNYKGKWKAPLIDNPGARGHILGRSFRMACKC